MKVHKLGDGVVERGTRLNTVFAGSDGHAWTEDAGRDAMGCWGRDPLPRAERGGER